MSFKFISNNSLAISREKRIIKLMMVLGFIALAFFTLPNNSVAAENSLTMISGRGDYIGLGRKTSQGPPPTQVGLIIHAGSRKL
jgi:hypothetical protein